MKRVGRNQKVLYNSVTNGLYQIILLVSGLILPRFILVAYGSAYNGLVSSLGQFLGITEVLTMGLAGAARVELYDSLAHQDIKRTSGIVKAVKRYMYKAAVVFLVYMLVLLVIYPKFVNEDFSFAEIAPLLLIIGIGNIVSYVCGYAYNVLLDADNSVYLYTLLRTFLTIANLVISIVLIKFGQTIQIVKFASALIYAIGPAALFLIVPKIYKLDAKEAEDRSWKQNQKYAAANSIALIIHENTDAVLLTVLTNTKMVSVYSVYNLVIKGLKGILGIFTSSMEPLLGNMWAKQEMDAVETTLKHYEYFIGFIASIMLSSALGLILPFVFLYTQGVTDIDYILPVFALVMVLAELARCIRNPYLTVIQAAGKYRETQIGAFLEAGLNISTSIVLTIRFGIVGVAIGTIIANLFRTLDYSWHVSKLLHRSMKRTFYILLWSLFNLFINVGVFKLICAVFGLKLATWPLWLMGAVIIVTLSLVEVIGTSAILFRSDMNWLLKYAKKIYIKLKR